LPIDLTKMTPNSPTVAPSLKIKKSRNDKTPTPHAKAKALFHTTSTSTQNQSMTNTTAMTHTSTLTVAWNQQAKALLESTAAPSMAGMQAKTNDQDNSNTNTKGNRDAATGQCSAREHQCTLNGRYAGEDQHD